MTPAHSPRRSTLTLVLLLVGLAISLVYHSPARQSIDSIIVQLIGKG